MSPVFLYLFGSSVSFTSCQYLKRPHLLCLAGLIEVCSQLAADILAIAVAFKFQIAARGINHKRRRSRLGVRR